MTKDYPSPEAMKVADLIIKSVEDSSGIKVNGKSKKEVFPKAEGIYHTIKMINESDEKSLKYLLVAIQERIKELKSK
jgi:hypothetical protein